MNIIRKALRPGFSSLTYRPARCLTLDNFEMVKFEQVGRVGLITLNRPKALNALCDQLMTELNSVMMTCGRSPEIGALVVTGSEKAFAAGADLKEMRDKTFQDAYLGKMLHHWNDFTKCQVPVIAAVNGYALGGGFELALMADVIYAGSKARFGLVELTVGTIPGCGGTQRLIREVGKSRAMEMVLTAEHMLAPEALSRGLVAKVFEPAELVSNAMATAEKMAGFSKNISVAAKDSVNMAYNLPLDHGLEYEKRMFWGTFATNDQKEGMAAFSEKRKAEFKHS